MPATLHLCNPDPHRQWRRFLHIITIFSEAQRRNSVSMKNNHEREPLILIYIQSFYNKFMRSITNKYD